MSLKTRFVPESRQLVVGMGRNPVLPDSLLEMLLDEGILEDTKVERKWLGTYLTLTLAQSDELAATTLVCRLAGRLSKIPGHLVVYDPWTIGGRAVNMELALDLIGDVFRSPVSSAAIR